MDAETGARGANAGNDFNTVKSGHGLGAVAQRLAAKTRSGEGVAISTALGWRCALDALEVFEAVVGDELLVSERCVSMVCQGHGAARSMAWFSPTAWARILRLIRQMAAAGQVRYQLLLARLHRIVGHCIAANVYGIVAKRSANEACVLSSLWMVLLFERGAFYTGDALERVVAVLRKCEGTLHCAYTAAITNRLAGQYLVDLAGHIQEFEVAHGEHNRRTAAVVAPLVLEPRALVPVIFLLNLRWVDTESDGQVPLLAMFVGEICTEMLGSRGAVGMAAHTPLRAVLGVERGHIGLELAPPPGFANLAHWYLHLANLNLSGDASLTREGSHTFDHTLGFRAADGPQSVTYLGMQVQALWPARGRAALTRLRNARRGPYGFVDVLNLDARHAFFELQRDEATEHSGSQEPAEILARPQGEWRRL